MVNLAHAILAALWLVALLPSLAPQDFRDAYCRSAGYTILALVALAALGMLWADIPWHERFEGFSSYPRLLCIPLLYVQFSRSEHAARVMIAFAVSCTALLGLSWLAYFLNAYPLAFPTRGIPFKDYISQSAMLTVTLLFFVRPGVDAWAARRQLFSLALAVLAAICLLNIFYVATSRTALVVTTLLLIVFGFRQFGWRGAGPWRWRSSSWSLRRGRRRTICGNAWLAFGGSSELHSERPGYRRR